MSRTSIPSKSRGPSQRPARVCLCWGMWQSLTLTASLRTFEQQHASAAFDDHLVLICNRSPDAFGQATERVVKELWPWKSIYVLESMPRGPWRKAKTFWRNRRGLRQHLHGQYIESLWTHQLVSHNIRALIEIFPDAKIYTFEEGLLSHVQRPQSYSLKHVISWVLNVAGSVNSTSRVISDTVHPLQRKRICGEAYLIRDALGFGPQESTGVPAFSLQPETFRSVMEHACDAIGDDVIRSQLPAGIDDGRTVLAVGQCFGAPSSNSMDPKLELAHYQRMVSRLIVKGYRVLWKEHPRNFDPYGLIIAKDYSPKDFVMFAPEAIYPLELYVLHLKLRAIVGVCSSALFNVPLLYNVPAYTIARDLLPNAGVLMKQVHRLAAERLPDLEHLPPA